ncbi:Chromosome partition protein Smc [Carpediemonas membranifera]|uniref:Chromosome partition protein Smc n=1 Tax=Carpediemonas membranifera TaxID=201153 RepID=A0A8J6AWI9_9EUKA|nr:Chromosome partition protein Smc [Carpediemonas membranifera]|eukprot:KAG9396631.1 Chromosome partition protein Smc [Carpediemonas membranifera]
MALSARRSLASFSRPGTAPTGTHRRVATDQTGFVQRYEKLNTMLNVAKHGEEPSGLYMTSKEERQLERQLRSEISQLKAETSRYRALYENELIKAARGGGSGPNTPIRTEHGLCSKHGVSQGRPARVGSAPPVRMPTLPPAPKPIPHSTFTQTAPMQLTPAPRAVTPEPKSIQTVPVAKVFAMVQTTPAPAPTVAAVGVQAEIKDKEASGAVEKLKNEQRALERVRRELVSAQDSNEALKKELADAQSDARRSSNAVLSAERAEREQRERVQELTARIAQSEAKARALESTGAEQASERESAISQLRQELHITQHRLKESLKLHSDSTRTAQDLREEIAALETALKAARAEAVEQGTERRRLEAELSQVTKTAASTTANESGLRAEVDRLTAAQKWKNDELERRSRRITALEQAHVDGQAAVEDLRQQLDDLSERLEQAQTVRRDEPVFDDGDSFDAVLARELAAMREAYEARIKAIEGTHRDAILKHAAALHELQGTFQQERALLQSQIRMAKAKAGM